MRGTITLFSQCSPQTRRRCRGAAAVELGLILVLLVTVLAGVVEGGRVLWFYDALTKGTRDAARYASVLTPGKLSADVGTIKDFVVKTARAAGVMNLSDEALNADNVTVTCHSPTKTGDCAFFSESDAKSVDRVTVSVDYSHTIGELIPFIPGNSTDVGQTEILQLRPETTMPYMW